MQQSKQISPQVLTVMEANMSRVVAHRSANKASFAADGVNLTFTAYFMVAIAAALKANPVTRDIPVVMLTAAAQSTMVDRAMELGADSYVMKPVTLEELEKAMATAFYKHINMRE